MTTTTCFTSTSGASSRYALVSPANYRRWGGPPPRYEAPSACLIELGRGGVVVRAGGRDNGGRGRRPRGSDPGLAATSPLLSSVRNTIRGHEGLCPGGVEVAEVRILVRDHVSGQFSGLGVPGG